MSTTPPVLDMAAILHDTSNRVVVCCGAGGCFGVSATAGASTFAGVRDERFGPAAAVAAVAGFGLGTSLRVIRPCPTVQRFVVIQ